jgi:hypothetical protein
MFKALIIDDHHITIDEGVWLSWLDALYRYIVDNKGYLVKGRGKSQYVVILDPGREHGFDYMTPLGQSLYVQHLADTTNFMSIVQKFLTDFNITDYRNEATWFTYEIVDNLLEDAKLKESLLAHHEQQEKAKKSATKLLRRKQMASLRSQAGAIGIEPNFFRGTKDELFYVFDALYKVPDDENDPDLCNPKHLVAKEIVDFY